MHLIELAMAREVIRSGIADMMKGIDDTEVSNVVYLQWKSIRCE